MRKTVWILANFLYFLYFFGGAVAPNIELFLQSLETHPIPKVFYSICSTISNRENEYKNVTHLNELVVF